ncbi:ATP-binding protein [Novosphingobium lentum]|uniref:ATP-binding protein n=1 Tax=Novosphingobium lentum TaxID=145287 RepID=UPI0008368671|nr:ATP-binding protein [Novosphingobium lentum]
MAKGITISLCHRAGDDPGATLYPALVATHQFAAVRKLDAAMTSRLAIIVEEVATNVIDHAAPDRDVTLTLHLGHGSDGLPDGLVITLEDDSAAFDPRTVEPHALPNPDRGGGVGLALVKAWSDIVAYDSAGGINRLVLRLHPRPASPA